MSKSAHLARFLRFLVGRRDSVQPDSLAGRDRKIGDFKLKFTGNCDEAEFQARCAEHDFWYHSYYFDNGFAQRGDYDIGRDIDDYGFPADMQGMTVLDVGTGSGWFATFFEQRGAAVTTLDARGPCDFDIFGRDHNPPVTEQKSRPDRVLPDGRPVYYSPVSKGFWVMKEILGLKADFFNGRVYDICPELFGGKTFDLVFLGSILMHLRDPIGALMAAHTVCGQSLIANIGVLPNGYAPEKLVMRLLPKAGDGIGWWTPTTDCFCEWMLAAGFSRVDSVKTLHLTADRPWTDPHGTTSGVSQIHKVIHASR
jgi:SAM-dependent methyltransferase